MAQTKRFGHIISGKQSQEYQQDGKVLFDVHGPLLKDQKISTTIYNFYFTVNLDSLQTYFKINFKLKYKLIF